MSGDSSVVQPLVSILMTAYNRQQYIAEAIESVLAAEYNNWELIISDDCSTDTTFSIAQQFALNDKRIRLYKNAANLGDYPNRNQAAGYAKGEYMVIVDSDDRMFPETLGKWVTAMQNFNSSFGIFSYTGHPEIFITAPGKIIRQHFFNKPILNFGPVATIIATAYFKSIQSFPEKYGPANDMYYNLKAASQTNVLVFPFPLVDYRIHDGQEFNNKYSYLYNNYLYLRDALSELELPLDRKEINILIKKNKRRFLTNILKFYFKNWDWKATKAAIRLTGFGVRDTIVAVFQK